MPTATDSDASQLLERWSAGDAAALSGLIPLLYRELARLARSQLRRERGDHTLETSALVHEAYLRLVTQHSVACHHRGEFLAIAARTMRRVLIDHARTRGYQKRGADSIRLSLVEALLPASQPDVDLLELEDALVRLERAAPDQARVVELRVFAGLTAEEIAVALEISVPTVTRRWRAARAWLFRLMRQGA
jgi:RNA polymerase sigma factor (TIGR02999 family)